MRKHLQKYLHPTLRPLVLLIIITALSFLGGCKQSYCPAYSYAPMQPVHKQTWNGNQKPKAVKKKTAHYAYKKKPNKVQQVWANLMTVNGWN